MIKIKRIEPKKYDDLLNEAFMQIPLYSSEWTNFNPSDPGVTILENITAFNVLQQNQMGRTAEDIREKLLEMMGFKSMPGHCARVLLAAKGARDDFYIPAGQKFKVGNVNFETSRRSIVYANNITAVKSVSGDKVTDCSALIDPNSQSTVRVFGRNPKCKDKLYIFFAKKPEPSSELIFWFDFDDRFHRTCSTEKKSNDFAEIEWSYYTAGGFEPVNTKDMTHSFLSGGEVRFTLPDTEGCEFKLGDTEGYCICAELTRAEYDVAPRFSKIYGFLFEVWQKETRSICHTFSKSSNIEIYCDLLEDEYISVFCKESGEDYYRMYKPAFEQGLEGRYYNLEHKAFGLYDFGFDKNTFKYAPGPGRDTIKVVAYDHELMNRYELGTVYGYDDQEIELPMRNIVPESFTLIAELKNEQDESIYSFVRPGRKKEGSLYYTLDELSGRIVIRDAGDYVGARLYMCSCAVTAGTDGNVRRGNIFKPVGYDTDIVFYNPCSGEGGRLKESLDDVQKRFVSDLNASYTAVREEDYENLVRNLPDLCIRKVKAIADTGENNVRIVAMPYSDNPFPLLSQVYIRKIKEYLDERRILTTGIDIIQPVYISVDVSGTIYVKKHYENCRNEIEAVFNKHLDYINGSQDFGEVLHFENLFREIEELPCVEYIFDLSVYPETSRYARTDGLDIKPDRNGLLYPGKYYFEINTYAE